MAAQSSVTLRQMSYFAAVYEQGSLRRAADRLEVTQPTLTSQIAAMERALGVVLFERSKRGATPTVAGRELHANVMRIQEEVQGLMDAAAGLAGQGGGTYKLGVTPTLGPYLLPHLLPGIHRRHETLRLYVREAAPSDLEQGLRTGEHDLILSTLPINASDLVVEPLFREPVLLVLPAEHPLSGRDVIDRGDLAGEEVLTIDEHHLYHRQISELCERLGATVRRDYEGTSLDTLRQMVVMGMGVAFLPALYVASEIGDSDTVRVASVRGAQMLRHHALAWRARSPARGLFKELALEIRQTVRAELQELVRAA